MEKSYEEASKHLKKMSDDELKDYFWELAEEVVDPLLKLAYENTSPAIERSVLLRMGFSSVEATGIVNKVIQHEMMGKGAGHIVYRLKEENDSTIREAGLSLLEDENWDQVEKIFNNGKAD